MLKNLCISYILLLLSLTSVCGQEATFKGRVVDEIMEPVEGANLFVKGYEIGTITDENGKFEFKVPAGQDISVQFSHVSLKNKEVKINIDANEQLYLTVTLYFSSFDVVEISEKKNFNMTTVPKIDPGLLPSVSGNFEDIVKSFIGVSSNNELTANYNVRGGNYDENLIYVNDIEIYRPMIARAGQQEGLSFIHSELVDNVDFSAGGFSARYGDKLASVLDIEYKEPDDSATILSATGSLMGGQVAFGKEINPRFNFLVGGRVRANAYLLNSLPVEGEYRPFFADLQTLTRFKYSEDWKFSLLTHYSNNRYRVIPQNRETSFGTVNQALSLRVFFEGQEVTAFETFTGALSLETTDETREVNWKFITSAFISDETESFDVLGQYFINELETDLGSEELGDSTSNIGIGSFLNHARNRLNIFVWNAYFKGDWDYQLKNKNHSGKLFWGGRVQYENVLDQLSEWEYLDSAGYSLPQTPSDEVQLFEVLRTDNSVESVRTTAYIQNRFNFNFDKESLYSFYQKDSLGNEVKALDTLIKSESSLGLDFGVRGGYWSFNDEPWITPRVSLSYQPRWYFMDKDKVYRRLVLFRFATGLYYQPPFFREIRDIFGNINPNVKAQKSLHVVAGSDIYVNIWDRPFKLTTELYYKYLWDVNPYEIDNVRLRYYADNNARAFAYGADFAINGEFVPGVESWFKIGLLRTKEDLLDDFYYIRTNAAGDTIIPGFTNDQVAVDSIRKEPGFIPRPTDQLLSISLLFQDNMPGFEALKVQLNTLFGTPLPFGPPTYDRYKDTLRTSSYFRVDIGFSYDFLHNKPVDQRKPFFKKFEDIRLSFEVFNLLNINNTINYLWLQDVSGRNYAIPNSLTVRRLNLSLLFRF